MMLLLCTWIFKPTILNRIEWNLSEEINNTTSHPFLWSRSTVTNLSICPSPLLNAKSRFCCSACALHNIRCVLSKMYHFKDFLFFSQNFDPQKSHWYSMIYSCEKLAFFYQVNPMKTRLFSNCQWFVYRQAKGFVAIKIQPLCQSDLSWKFIMDFQNLIHFENDVSFARGHSQFVFAWVFPICILWRWEWKACR